MSSPHRDDLYILPDVSHLVNTFSKKTKNNFHSSANTGVGNKISVVSPPIQENPYNVYYNINRPVEPPHQLQPKPFHNHHGNSPTRSSFPSGAVFARHNASSKKKLEKFKKSVDNYRPREYNIRVLATIAQLAEHLIRNERVVGSNPISGSKKSRGCRICDSLFFACIHA